MAEKASQTITIAAAPERVWAIASDFEHYPEWAKDVKDVIVRGRDAQGRPDQVEYRASALGRSTHYTLSYDYSEAPNVLAWHMVRGDIMRTIDGAYHFSPAANGGTEVRYDLAIELVVPLPGFVKRRAEVRILNTVRELKARGGGVTLSRRPKGLLGIDVGGTKCLAIVIDASGAVVAQERRETPRNPEALIDTIADLAHAMRPWESIGIGMPGLVTRGGVFRAAPNLVGIRDLPVGELLGGRLACRVYVDSDATCAATAEWKLGASRDTDDFVMITLGTGIGGGVVAGGALIRGANGFTGEIGHMVVDPDGPACPCGRRGCWERYASGAGLAWLARRTNHGNGIARATQLAGGDHDAVRGEHVAVAARENDAGAVELVDEYARWVALGLVNLTNVLDPAMFVLGGGLAATADVFLAPIKRWFGELLYAPDLRPHPALVFAELGEKAGAIGAALLPTVH